MRYIFILFFAIYLADVVDGQQTSRGEFIYKGVNYQPDIGSTILFFSVHDSIYEYDSVATYWRKLGHRKAYRIYVMNNSIIVAEGPMKKEKCSWDPSAYYREEGMWFYYDRNGVLLSNEERKFQCICIKC